MMKITFVGTSHGVPAADRYCSATMIEAGNSIYFIDAGAPLIDQLFRYGKDLNNLRALFITHAHTDHSTGMIHLVDLMNWRYRETSADFYLPEQELIDATLHWIRANHSANFAHDRLRFHVFDENFVYGDENVQVSAFPTKHLSSMGVPTYGFVVTDKESGKRVVFSGDLSGRLLENDFPAVALNESVEALICEMAHFKIEHAAPYLERCQAKAVYFNHVGPFSGFDDLYAADGQYPFPIHAVADGDELVL